MRHHRIDLVLAIWLDLLRTRIQHTTLARVDGTNLLYRRLLSLFWHTYHSPCNIERLLALGHALVGAWDSVVCIIASLAFGVLLLVIDGIIIARKEYPILVS